MPRTGVGPARNPASRGALRSPEHTSSNHPDLASTPARFESSSLPGSLAQWLGVSSDAMIVLNARGHVVRANRNAEQLFAQHGIALQPGQVLLTAESLARVRRLVPLMGNDPARVDLHWARTTGAAAEAPPLSLHGALFCPADAQGLAVFVANVVETEAALLENANRDLAQLAHYDPLTGLANRTLLNERLEHAIASARRRRAMVALLFLDLDDFKRVNDNFGHAAGDQMLCEVAERLRSVVRSSDTIARQGGDEFIVLLENVQNAAEVKMAAQRVIDLFTAPFQVSASSLAVTTSVGISLFPQDGATADELMRNADAAMYQAKASGRNRVQQFSNRIEQTHRIKFKLESSLLAAIERREFFLHYQPIVDLQSRQIVAAEALLRWQHPELGLVRPEEFIGLAEETGAIVPIGEWLLKAACEQALRWKKAGHSLRVAVNVSARQFASTEFPLRVAAVLSETGLPAAQLELELTESTVMRQVQTSLVTLNWLRSLGVCFALDDFGTGYSSLSYLKQFPLDRLKIDRSFVQDLPEDQHGLSIVKAVVSMAKGLGLAVTAEGVESGEQAAQLAELGCAEGQGFWFAKPERAAMLTKRMSA